jgi:uncharacterized lipoprotein YehR (DUF1307 family)
MSFIKRIEKMKKIIIALSLALSTLAACSGSEVSENEIIYVAGNEAEEAVMYDNGTVIQETYDDDEVK